MTQLVRHSFLGPFCLQGVDAVGNRYCQRTQGGPWYHSNTPDGKPVAGDVVAEVALPAGAEVPYQIKTNTSR